MKPKMKALLKQLAVVDLEIEGEEFELNVEEMLDLEEDDLGIIHEKIAVLGALEGFLKQTLEDTKTELAFFEADKDENIRSTGNVKREGAVLAQIRTDPEWSEKRRDKAICQRELDTVAALKEALVQKIDAGLISILKNVSVQIAESDMNIDEGALVALLTSKLAKRKKRAKDKDREKKKEEKKKKKKKKNKNTGGSRRYTDQKDVLSDDDDLSEDKGCEDFDDED